MIELQIEIPFFHGTPFLLERMTDRQIMAIQTVSGICFQKMSKVSLWLQGKQLTVFLANDKI